MSERIPHKCPKCNGTGYLRYNPQMPFSDTSSCGPWHCNACVNGIIWESPVVTWKIQALENDDEQ